MLLIKIALYYRERGFVFAGDGGGMATAALAMLTPPCPQKFWWKAAGNGVFWRQDITCSDRGVHSMLHTRIYLPWPIRPWMRPCELFVPLKAKQIFFRCFYPSKKLKILQIQCNSSTGNFTTMFCKHRARQGGHSHLVTPPFPIHLPIKAAFCSQVTSHNPISLRDRMNWATS